MRRSEQIREHPTSVSSSSNVDRYLVFAFGVIFVSVILYLVISVQNPSVLAINVFTTVLALAAGGIGAILPGFLEVEFKGLLRAGGALGLAALVYLKAPAVGAPIIFSEPKAQATPIAEALLNALATGNPSSSWNLIKDSAAKAQLSDGEESWDELYRNDYAPLGRRLSHALISEGQFVSPPGYPPGRYCQLGYRSKFATGDKTELITLRADGASWSLFNYDILPPRPS